MIFSILLFYPACGEDPGGMANKMYVIMDTDLGEITLVLYNDTPIHKENFIKNVENGIYDGVSFHRVIRNFMVQTGDPLSKENPPKVEEEDQSIEAEILEKYVHTAGKLAAARKPDDINPERRSSSNQFFIVTGEPITYSELEATELALNNSKRAELYNTFQENPSQEKDFETFLEAQGHKDKIYYDQSKIRAYARLGGAPHLDFQYTIFGEVVRGMEIIHQIEQIPTEREQPLQTVRINKVEVVAGNKLKDRNKES